MKIKIEEFKSSYRLRFTYPKGNRNTITVAPATKEGLVKAQQVSQRIELDILNNSFDLTLSKYSFTNTTSQEQTITSLWEQYKEVKQDITSTTTQLEPWRQTDSCLSKLPSKLLQLDKADEAIAYLLKIYSVGTLERTLANLRAACNLAVQKQQLKRNPYQYLKLPKRQKPLIECYSDDEIKEIIDGFADTRHIDYVQFLAYTFCRPEEACALSVSDIDLSSNTIRFDKAYSRGILKATKNNKVRLFPINNQLRPLAIKLVSTRENVLFTNSLGKRLEHRNWGRDVWRPQVSQLVSQGRVKKYLKCYCLRHSGITRLIRSNYDVATVARLAGTSTEMIFRSYLASRDTTDLTLPEI
jgi:integrase